MKLLDWTGRHLARGKRAAIPSQLAPILERLRINGQTWLEAVEHFDRWFGHVVARVDRIGEKAAAIGRHWLYGTRAAAQAFT